ncbi:hypothetical protein ACQ3I4_14260 [Zafaria sp. Z1313]|uniref:hypothetical protein n=1 Tax=unclassified Zafaria TaxID=2828765 RepID=UPI002E79DF6A|nr:hypothetical protein [Zafaria sp. J156]MEE1622088.1 hypothetical protein [Zafaria sp. J156]
MTAHRDAPRREVTESRARATKTVPPLPTSAAALAIGAVALLAGCGMLPERGCPAIGLATGVSLTIAADIVPADPPAQGSLTWCQDGACHEVVLELFAGSDTVDLGCDGDGPDDACSASSVPNGTLHGFWPAPELLPGAVEVAFSAEGLDEARAALEAGEVSHGAGQCRIAGTQLALVLDGQGLREATH